MTATVQEVVDTPFNGNEQSFLPGPQVRLDEKELKQITDRVDLMYRQMQEDREALDHYAEYARGNQSDPYIPNYADPTTRDLAERSTLNLMTLAINVPAQISFIDGYSRKGDLDPKEWQCWHDSNMPTKQTRLFISSLTYGQGYTMLSNIGTEDRRIDLLSSRDTIAYFEDAVNDTVPVWGLTIKSRPSKVMPGRAIYMDAEAVYHLDFDGAEFTLADNGYQPHGLGMTPMVRWPAILDDRGYARGVVEDLIPAQDRVNQTVYDGLLNQTFGAYQVRYAAGLVGTPLFNNDGTPRVDADGNQVYGPIEVSQSRMLTTDDPNAKFGTLDATPHEGFILALDSAIRSFAVTGQLPPHSLMGSMSNLSAETLQALMAQTTRFTSMLKGSWADAALTQMKIVAKDMGITDGVNARDCEIRWRDMEVQTMSATVDALGKASQMLGVPGRGLWSWIPGATDSEINKWEELQEEQQHDVLLGNPNDPQAAMNREVSGQQKLPIEDEQQPAVSPDRETLKTRVANKPSKELAA